MAFLRSRWGRVVVGLAVFGILIAIFAWWVWVRPWQVGPDEPSALIEARWKAAVALAEVPTATSPSEGLRKAMAQARAFTEQQDSSFDDSVRRQAIEGPTLVLGADGEQSVLGLIAWHEAGGLLGKEVCTSTSSAFLALSLATLALASASGDPADVRVLATANLAGALMRRGRLFDGMVGAAIVDRLIERAKALTQPIGPWRQMIPDVKSLASMIAREYVCAHEMISATGIEAQREQWQVIGPNVEKLGGPKLKEVGEGWSSLSSLDRELAHFRAYFAAWVERFARAGADPDLLRAASERPEGDLPPSFVVRISAPSDLAHLVDTWLRTQAALVELDRREPAVALLWQARAALDRHVTEHGAFPLTLADVDGAPEGVGYEPRSELARLSVGDLEIEVPLAAPLGEPIELRSLEEEDAHDHHRHVSIDLKDVVVALEDGARLAAQGTWRAVAEEEGGGFRLTRSLPGGLYEQLGLMDGDQVTRLDGRLLGDEVSAKARLQAALRAGDLEILYTRAGAERSLRARIRDDEGPEEESGGDGRGRP